MIRIARQGIRTMNRLNLAILFSLTLCGLLPGEDIPKGEVIQRTFSGSKIFPGTVRDYWVYIPKQYDPAKPACLHVNQDGVQFKAPEVLDELIHNGEIPVMVGLFVMHGKVPAPNDNSLDRFNRSFEYDGLGDEYARFILEEMIPEVEKLTTSDGRRIHLSKSGNDRSIGGTSSGAICAFTAAWERPDAFTRVYSGIGTYVGLRGGDRYHTLIRKTEPKAIRVFLQDGSNDLNIYGGDWWMANQTMERALTFAGYEVQHVWDEGKHNNEEPTKRFPEGMKYLWKDWPTPVKKGLGPPQLQTILLPEQEWQLVGEGYKFTEGPTANEKGEVFFTDVPGDTSHKVDLDGNVTVFRSETKRGNGQVVGPDGRLYMVASGADEIVAIDSERNGTTVAKGFAGNDIAVRHDGGLYVTNPVRPPATDSKVWFIPRGGEPREVDTGLKFRMAFASLLTRLCSMSPTVGRIGSIVFRSNPTAASATNNVISIFMCPTLPMTVPPMAWPVTWKVGCTSPPAWEFRFAIRPDGSTASFQHRMGRFQTSVLEGRISTSSSQPVATKSTDDN